MLISKPLRNNFVGSALTKTCLTYRAVLILKKFTESRSLILKKVFSLIFLLLILTSIGFSQVKDLVQFDQDQNYLVLSTKKIGTMEKELDEVAAKGFRVLYSAPTQQFDMALFLKRDENSIETPFTYKILATSRLSTMKKELNEFAGKGYRFLPRTAIFKEGLFTAEFVTIMERSSNPTTRYEYKLVQGRKEVKVHKEIESAIAEGFQPITMIILGEHVVIMEKEILLKP